MLLTLTTLEFCWLEKVLMCAVRACTMKLYPATFTLQRRGVTRHCDGPAHLIVLSQSSSVASKL